MLTAEQRRRCARCEWRPEDDETLAEHSEATDHPLCVNCGVSLPSDRPRVCRDCQDATATHLAEIEQMWSELPDLLDAYASARLPGGDALVLAGPGARGVQGAVVEAQVPWWLGAGHVGPVTAKEWRRRCDRTGVRGEISDNLNADTPSVAWTLVSWADDWRHVRGEDVPERESVAGHYRVVVDAHAYLTENGPWAAEHHWSWPEFAADIRHLHHALLIATWRYRHPTRLGLNCFVCNGKLVYQIVRDADAKPPQARPRWWVGKGVAGPVTLAEWNERTLGTAGLEEDHATCRDCGLTYDTRALLLAQRQAVEELQWLDDDDGKWGTVKAVAEHVHRSAWTLRTWERQGLVRASRHGGVLYLHLGDVERESELRDQQWMQDDDGKWGTVKAVAEHVHRSPATVQRWQEAELVRSRRLPGVGVYVHLGDVERESAARATRTRSA